MSDSAEIHPSRIDPKKLLEQCRVTFTRRSGPGGQNRNKVETAAVLEHLPTGLRAEAAECRTQGENRRAALFRLRMLLALELRSPQKDGEILPSLLWTSRCKGGRISVNPEHDDVPALLAEALDALAVCGMDVPAAASALGCSSTQLTRFLQVEPRALGLVNEHRRSIGLKPLR
ncbi:peptide chain release factor-like protein [Isosphaeraceae bacterium EP7]